MKKMTALLKLEVMMLKPYISLLNVLILIALGVVFGLIFNMPFVPISIFMSYANTYVSSLFNIGDRGDIHTLLSFTSIRRKDYVKSVYLFIVAATILCFTFTLLIIFLVTSVLNAPMLLSGEYEMKAQWDMIGVIVPSTAFFAMIYALISSVQIPVYFKNGFMKAHKLTSIQYAVYIIVLILALFVTKYGWEIVSGNILPVILFSVLATITALTFSYLLSVRIYGKKDL